MSDMFDDLILNDISNDKNINNFNLEVEEVDTIGIN